VPFTGSLNALRLTGAGPHARMAQYPRLEHGEITLDLLSARPDTGLAQLIVGWMRAGWVDWLSKQGGSVCTLLPQVTAFACGVTRRARPVMPAIGGARDHTPRRAHFAYRISVRRTLVNSCDMKR